MKSVFIGGSRKITTLDDKVKCRTDKIVSTDMMILIGDANGADKAIQKYLAGKNYRNVIVFCTGSHCRNNLGKWDIQRIIPNRNVKDFEYYTLKDIAMSDRADYGFMLWDGQSNGTLNNILNLVEREKQVVLYFSPEKRFLTISNMDDVKGIIALCNPVIAQRFNRKLRVNNRMEIAQRQISFTEA